MQVVKFFLAEPGQMFHVCVQIFWKLVWYPKREGGWNISLMQAYCNLLRAGSWQKYDSKPSSKIYHSKPREYIGKMHWIQNLPLFFLVIIGILLYLAWTRKQVYYTLLESEMVLRTPDFISFVIGQSWIKSGKLGYH